jgi:phosphoenolpyruvate carboxykinase (GTP)
VPISAFIFGGRRSTLVPLVFEARDWNHGVYVGATMGSEKTAAAAGKVGEFRQDPFAMLPFCGYNMADYFGHWIRMGGKIGQRPRIFHVNWFRKDENGKFLWPGFGDNMRVLKWIVERVKGTAKAKETLIGLMPDYDDLEWKGLDFPKATWDKIMAIDVQGWKDAIKQNQDYFRELGEDRIPAELKAEQKKLLEKLG